MLRTRIGLAAVPAALLMSATAQAQLPDILVLTAADDDTNQGAMPCADRLIMLRDLNMDGDYDDLPDECATFHDSGGAFATFTGMRSADMRLEAGNPTAYWANATNPRGIYRGQDTNGNGLIEAGETTFWNDNTIITGNTSPAGTIGTDDGAVWYSHNDFNPSDPLAGLLRTIDNNNDGDSMDAGESITMVGAGHMVPTNCCGMQPIDAAYFQNLTSFGNAVVAYSGDNFVSFIGPPNTNALDDCLYRFEDLNMDGDVLDAGESILFLNAVGKNPNLDVNPDFFDNTLKSQVTTAPSDPSAKLENIAVQQEGADVAWYVANDSSLTGPIGININNEFINGMVFRGVDGNGDGDINDAGEITTFYDDFGAGQVNKILGMKAFGGSVYLLDLLGGTFGIHRLTDMNSDGDALDPGERTVVFDANFWIPNDPLFNCTDPTTTPPTVFAGPFVTEIAVFEPGVWAAPMQMVPTFSESCNGDGGDQLGCTDCPCGNNSAPGTVGGCINSAGTSTRLLGSGTNSIVAADLRFEASGVPPAPTSAVLTSGNALAPAQMANPCFGLNSGVQSVSLDGLRCAVQGVLRHGVRQADMNGEIGVLTNGWGDPNGFFNFGAFMASQTKHFQIIHRDDVAQVCQTGQNTSQAVSTTFTP